MPDSVRALEFVIPTSYGFCHSFVIRHWEFVIVILKILPVLDLLDGIVVRGIAGKRKTYRPVESQLLVNADPLLVAEAFRDHFGLTEIYLADLDAILHDRPNLPIYEALVDHGFSLIVDAGLRDILRAGELFAHGVSAVIAGLETAPGPELLGDLTRTFHSDRILFSLDLKNGEPLGDLTLWETSDPFEIGRRAVDAGITRMIVLDLAAVGVHQGISTIPLCQRLQDHFPELEIITGGGIRDADDLKQLAANEIDGVLIASALHNGRIDAATLRAFG
jgi:phosphoribosylformimino-5-aminoimidazole carboxamide ribotide isomerase